MKTRKGSHGKAPSDDGALESWLHDLVGGETTARRLRKRLEEQAGDHPEADCAVCDGTSASKIYFGLDGHVHGRLSA